MGEARHCLHMTIARMELWKLEYFEAGKWLNLANEA